MSQKSDQNTSIKDYLLGPDNQHNKTKTKSIENTNNKPMPVTKSITMNKEGSSSSSSSTSSKSKAYKPSKGDKSLADESTGKSNQQPTQKRDASTRSPLDGNPEKRKQKENRRLASDETCHRNPNDSIGINDTSTHRNSTDITTAINETTPKTNGTDVVNQEETYSLLKELMEIKKIISSLNDKVELNHQDLASKIADSIEMKEIISCQNEKIDKLNRENTELRSSNMQLEKDILQLQESSSRLKVDISGIQRVVTRHSISYDAK